VATLTSPSPGGGIEKIGRVHKNQAVNLQQILIHGPATAPFRGGTAVKIGRALASTAFQPIEDILYYKDEGGILPLKFYSYRESRPGNK